MINCKYCNKEEYLRGEKCMYCGNYQTGPSSSSLVIYTIVCLSFFVLFFYRIHECQTKPYCIKYSYNNNNYLIQAKDSDGIVKTYEYDKNGNKISYKRIIK